MVDFTGFDFLAQPYLPLKSALQKDRETVAECKRNTKEAAWEGFPFRLQSYGSQ